ncbi:MAG TPA: DNA polymerase III subunit beta [Alphaproteobacteria bacterium]|nr:DNA polymerase III subunit beta [Alphaproteobacteria bacterium]
MKFTIERTVLLRSLGHVQSIVERRTTIPILSNVLLQARDGKLDLTATDLDIAVRESAEANVTQAGATTAPAHTLHDIVRKLPEGAQVEISLDADNGRLLLKAGRSEFHLSCLPAADFPAMDAESAGKTADAASQFVIAAADLKRLIDKTRFAISTEETRYYLNGIYLHVVKTDGVAMLRAVATDGHRLARVELPAPSGADAMPGIILPRKAVLELHKLIDGVTGEVAVNVTPVKIRFAFDHVTLSTKLIDGTFPDYTRVIPTTNDKLMEVNNLLLRQAVDRVSTISSEKSRAVKVNLGKNQMTVSVKNPDQGSASEELAVSYTATPIEVGFNARYLLDVAAQIDGDNAIFEFFDAHSPALIRDSGDASAQYVLMPMRVA